MHISVRHTILIFALAILVLAGCKTNKSSVGPLRGGPIDSPYFRSEADKVHFDDLFFDGTKAKLIGRYDEAITKFEECLKVTQKVPDVYYQLFVCYTATGKQGAPEMLDMALELAPKNTWYLQEKAEFLKTNRRHLESANVYKKLIDLVPGKAEFYEEAVNQLVQAGKHYEAIDVLDKMEGHFGISADIIKQKEDLYLFLGKTDKAIAELKKLVQSMPDNIDYIGMLAELYLAAGKTDEALAQLQKILEVDPDNGKAHFNMAGIYQQKGDSANTIKELRLGFADPSVSVKEKINVILSMAPMGDTDPAYRVQVLELAEILVKAHENSPQAHAIYADLLFGDKKYAPAIAQYEKALELDPDNFRIWQQLLSSYEQMDDYTKLDEKSDEALELFPNRLVFYYFGATASYHLKKYKKAAATAQAGIDMGLNDDFLNLGLYSVAGDAYYKMGDYNLSYLSFDAALEIDPNNSYVLNNYAYYLSEQNERLEKALSMSKKALEAQPESPSYLDTYGWILYKTGRYDEALKYIEKALKNAPTDKEILEHLGDVNYRLGNKDVALEYWRKSKENGNYSAQLDKKINEGKLSD